MGRVITIPAFSDNYIYLYRYDQDKTSICQNQHLMNSSPNSDDEKTFSDSGHLPVSWFSGSNWISAK